MSRLLLLALPLMSALSSCGTQYPARPQPVQAAPLDPDGQTNLAPSGIIDGEPAITHNIPDLDLISAATPHTPLTTHRITTNGLTLTILTFDSRSHSLHVLDNEHGPGSGATTAKEAARISNAIAAINAGFFTPEGKPLGLVYEAGKKYGGLSTSSLGSGIYLHEPNQRISRLLRRTSWNRQTTTSTHLLQTGPFLLENKSKVNGLSNSRPRPRSFLLWNGKSGWAIAHSSSTTLNNLATTLASQPLPNFQIQHALNLDGGRSSDLWISSSVKGGPGSTRQLWNKNVRNYLVLVPNKQ